MLDQTIYQFTVSTLNGEEISLKQFQNKVLLIVNIASQCGFTPQLLELQILRKKFQGCDFEILAFPSNDFGQQEPLEGSAIKEFCEINFGTNFPVFYKIHVQGSEAHPLYKFFSDKDLNGSFSSVPKWNFHKYLINKNGELADFFYSFTKPLSSRVLRGINHLLAVSPVIV